MSHHIPEAVIWCLAVALTAVAILLVRQRGITAGVRRRVAQLEESLQARDEEVRHLVGVRLPAVAETMNQPVPLPGPLDERLAGTAFAQSLQSALELFTQAVDKAQARADQSAKAALKASMRALQGLAHEQQLAISDMQDRHDNPDVLRDLLEIDHANSQFGRRAQAIAVLCGSWPGRQRVASQLTDVVRGATSRIRDYRRVRVHSQADIAVVSRVVEPVVLAVAELLDNAARHSQPNTTVEVSLQPVHNGAVVVIDDAGVGMDGQEVQHAVALLSGQRVVDVSRLGDPPQFGFPVVGVLAARYGFSVSVDTRSPYGGVRAVLFLPSALLTHLEIDGPGTTPLRHPAATDTGRGTTGAPRSQQPPVRSPERPPAPEEFPAGHPDRLADDAPVTGSTAGGLPKRRRRQPPAPRPAAPPPAESPSERTAEQTARIMGAFARGTRSGRDACDPPVTGGPTGPADHGAPTPDDEGKPPA
ncbi:ATP-binding protein [Streptomyces netropsis]|uniref:ATP-binding protein n=1 Tax=Streptomyces netropsis TaxID=55404 RepID=UPI00378E58E0